MGLLGKVREYCWFFQKLLNNYFSNFVKSHKSIQLNQIIFNEQKDFLIIRHTSEKIGRVNYKQRSEYRAIFELSNPSLNPKTGVVWVQNKIVAESTIWHPAEIKKFEPKPIFPEYLDESVAILPDNGYFHFLTEELPRYLEVIKYFPNLISVYSSSSSNMFTKPCKH